MHAKIQLTLDIKFQHSNSILKGVRTVISESSLSFFGKSLTLCNRTLSFPELLIYHPIFVHKLNSFHLKIAGNNIACFPSSIISPEFRPYCLLQSVFIAVILD